MRREETIIQQSPLPSGYLVEDINGNEKLHLYPALRIADPKPGIYDTVNHQFYTNQGTGEFLYA